MNNKKGFTLVELLAVIVVLAIILIIASPQITETINNSKLKAMRDSAIDIVKNAEREYIVRKSSNQVISTMECTSLVDMSDDYGTCTLSFDNNGRVYLTLEGSSNGKFDDITCKGTRNIMNCSYKLQGYTDAVELLTGLCSGTCLNSEDNDETLDGIANDKGLFQDKYGDYRYQGTNPNNYVTFNNEEAGWRIVGLFDVDGVKRVKLVRTNAIGSGIVWYDTSSGSESSTNLGRGINQWGPSTYTTGGVYEGADLMRELNGDYLDLTLTANTMWYSGIYNAKTCTFNYTQRLNAESQSLIADATWYLGASLQNQTLADQYANERSDNVVVPGVTCSSSYCNDKVVRTSTWVGKVGLIYASDFAYASGNSECKNNIGTSVNNCRDNWMVAYGATISPIINYAEGMGIFVSNGYGIGYSTSYRHGPHPSVYLIPGVQMRGSGTQEDPYVIAK